MATAVGSITRAATRRVDEPLNVLTYPTHERWQSGLSGANAMFYMVQSPQVKSWSRQYAALPPNHILLNPSRGDHQLPPDVDFDLVLSQNKFGQYQIAAGLAKQLHLPLISLEHTLPVKEWGPDRLEACRQMRGDLNVFISEFSVGHWGFDIKDPSVRVIHHGVDTDTFSPNDMVCDRKPTLLSVVNDWVNRDYFCGFRLWQAVTKDLPVVVVGDTPGLSLPAKSVPDLVMKYRSSRVFLNTSLVSPIPTALLEAMSSGAACVSTATAMIPEVIQHGVNGLMSNDPAELRRFCQLLLKDEALAARLGAAARRTIVEKFSMGVFVKKWDEILLDVADNFCMGN